jgi:hypothetical protein
VFTNQFELKKKTNTTIGIDADVLRLMARGMTFTNG